MTRPTLRTVAVIGAAALMLAGCSTGGDPLSGGSDDSATIVIGSQDYYSNEIIAEIYAQVLEEDGHEVERDFRAGQREAYLPDIESGAIDLFPEYSGPVLQVWESETPARLETDVYEALVEAAPEGVRVLDQSPATDQDAYTVTRGFAEQWGLETIEDLTKVTVPLTVGGNSEGETRPNGPRGLKESYGLDVDFTPIEDGGGPLTVKALKDGDVQLAIIYTADPSVDENDLVSLVDTRGLFLASHVVPLASDKLDDDAVAAINRVSAAMSAEDLLRLNARSVEEGLPAATIAKDWIESEGL